MEAAGLLKARGVSAEVLDLRTVSPLDSSAIVSSVSKTGRLLVIDEDYKQFGLSGEIAALVLENSIRFKFSRVCTETIIPYSHSLEKQAIPDTKRIVETALELLNK
jgi:pyruvate dehydrogenase E1 component beta subunit